METSSRQIPSKSQMYTKRQRIIIQLHDFFHLTQNKNQQAHAQ